MKVLETDGGLQTTITAQSTMVSEKYNAGVHVILKMLAAAVDACTSFTF